MKQLLIVLFCLLVCCNLAVSKTKNESLEKTRYPSFDNPYLINPVAEYEGESDEDLNNVMVPIPIKDRVFNKTGVQCVWATLETCGRYAEEPKLIKLTELNSCKSFASPPSVAMKLKQLNIKFEQTVSKSNRSLIIKSVVQERRGCLFAIPGHAMTLVHYDEKAKIVKYINNSDIHLKIRTWSMEEFNRRWDGWICVIYADNDIIPLKYDIFIPIIDCNGPQGTYTKDYILQPQK